MKTYSIPDHWDTAGIINKNSNPKQEFETWLFFAKASPDWTGEEFTIHDFEEYINSLNKS